MMWGYYSPGMGWWMVLSSLFWLALVGIAVWAFVTWMRHQARLEGGRPGSGPGDAPSAEEILRQRFARGEIDRATFQAMRAELTSPAESSTHAAPGESSAVVHGSPTGR